MVTMVLLITLSFKATCPPFNTVTYVPDHVSEDTTGTDITASSGTLNKVFLNRILRVIHCINIRPGSDPL